MDAGSSHRDLSVSVWAPADVSALLIKTVLSATATGTKPSLEALVGIKTSRMTHAMFG